MEHRYIVGQSGRSTLLTDLMLETIHDGDGLFFIDPHGTDIDDLLHYIPRSRLKDTIVFDPTDDDHPIPFNPLHASGHPAVVTAAIETAIKDTAGYQVATPTMSLYIRASLYALIMADEPFLGLPFMLTSPTYRDHVLKDNHDPLLTRFWSQFELMTTKDKRLEIASTFNKAFALVLDTRIRRLFASKTNGWDMHAVLDGKIFLARLPQSLLGLDQTKALSHLLLSHFHLAARTRDNPFYVYLSDAHHLAGATLDELLQNGSRHGLTLTLSDPSPIKQFLPHIARKYVFRVSLADADLINEHQGPDNVNIPLYRLPLDHYRLFDGPARFENHEATLDWTPDPNMPAAIIKHSRRNYARSKDKLTRTMLRFINQT